MKTQEPIVNCPSCNKPVYGQSLIAAIRVGNPDAKCDDCFNADLSAKNVK